MLSRSVTSSAGCTLSLCSARQLFHLKKRNNKRPSLDNKTRLVLSFRVPHWFPMVHFSTHPVLSQPSHPWPALFAPPPKTGFLDAPASGSEVTTGWPPAFHPTTEIQKEQFPLDLEYKGHFSRNPPMRTMLLLK